MTSIAEYLLDTGAVNISPDDPFTLTSGKKSPVYVDCRRLIGFVAARNTIMEKMAETAKTLNIDVVAGGETAGIPYAGFLAERLDKPMAYVRKKPKGFGKNAQIEGYVETGQNVLLVEDLATDGGSKKVFVDALRKAECSVNHCMVVFHYGFADAVMAKMDMQLHALATWQDVLAVAEQRGMQKLDTVRAFLKEFEAEKKAAHAA